VRVGREVGSEKAPVPYFLFFPYYNNYIMCNTYNSVPSLQTVAPARTFLNSKQRWLIQLFPGIKQLTYIPSFLLEQSRNVTLD